MIVVSKDQQLHTQDISLQFFINIIGPSRAPKVITFFTAINSLGNIVGMTFAASRVKQEIAKEGIIPFAKFFGENRILFRRKRNQDSEAEPTPFGALFLHWMFAMLLILVTWATKPGYAYRILVNLYTYVNDVIPSFILGIGMLALRFCTNWRSKSPMPHWLSISAAFIFALVNAFPLVAIWIPPQSAKNNAVRGSIPGWPWYMTGAVSWALVLLSVVYWVGFKYVLPRVGRRKGKEFVVEREPVFRTVGGERVLWHEIVLHSWVVKTEPERREGYMLEDI